MNKKYISFKASIMKKPKGDYSKLDKINEKEMSNVIELITEILNDNGFMMVGFSTLKNK